MTDLVPVITSTTSVPETPTPAVIFTPVERIVRLGDLGIARENLRYGEPPDDDIPTLAATLKALKGRMSGPAGIFGSITQAIAVLEIPPAAMPYLERLQLHDPQTLQDKMLRKLIVAELATAGHI